MANVLAVGDKAPAFDLPASGGRLKLGALKGKPVVVYFYLKDDTSGCTREAIDFSARKKDFDKLGATVIGVSKDSVASHEKFARKHALKVALGADEDGRICEAYGVWVEKSLYGRKYMGIERATFLIDGTGKLRQIWRKVKVDGHADAVLAAAQAL